MLGVPAGGVNASRCDEGGSCVEAMWCGKGAALVRAGTGAE